MVINGLPNLRLGATGIGDKSDIIIPTMQAGTHARTGRETTINTSKPVVRKFVKNDNKFTTYCITSGFFF